LHELRRFANFRALDGIVISHLHVDHVLDVMALRFALAYNPIAPTQLMPLWLPPGGRAFLEELADVFGAGSDADTYFGALFDFREYDPDDSVRVGGLQITFAPTVHYVPCWAMRVHSIGTDSSIGYTADTGPAAELDDLLAGVNILIAEATLLDHRQELEPFETRGHLTAREAAELGTRVGAQTLVLTHLWEEIGLDRYADEARTAFDGRIVMAAPGQVIECA
jgi:ribonuclease BN (tRNA processing enzyme)